jgi:peptidoglycan hydrolase CwlO-like protein
MKKMLAILLLAIVVIGCGPKMAKQETLDAIAEARAALEAAQTNITELQGEIDALTAQRAELEQTIKGMEEETATIENKIDTRCNK